jgi:DNA end-binding protein Ku
LEPEEIAATVPQSDKSLAVAAFIPCADIDDLYFDRPYYLAPADRHAEEAYVLIRDGMRAKNVAAIGEAVLFRRLRKLLIRPYGSGLAATMLNFNHEVRSAADAFDEVPKVKIKDEMIDLARHIIETKTGRFDPAAFDDRYEAALVELVKAKIEGREIAPPRRREPEKVVDLMAALRESAGLGEKKKPATSRKKVAAGSAKKSDTAAKPRRSATRRKAG